MIVSFSDKCTDNVVILDDTNELWEVFHSMYMLGVACTFHTYSWKCTSSSCWTSSTPR